MSAIFGETLVFRQREGDDVELAVFGDEFYARYESRDGYTVVYDPDVGRYCFAHLAAGRFASTGVPLDKRRPPGTPTHLKESGAVRNESFGRRYAEVRPREDLPALERVRTLAPSQGLLEGRRVSEGTVRGLTVLVDFPDMTSSVTSGDVDALLNQAGYSLNGNRGSVRDYFLTVSNGKLDYRNTVVGPVRLRKNRGHYVTTNLVKEALDLAVRQFGLDLTDFDSHDQGFVDAVNFMYAGRTVYDGELWPHNSVRTLTYPGGVRTHFYMLTSMGRSRVDLSIGTFCHESGHLLCRFPDLYDYGEQDGDFEKSAGIGDYCLMGSGNHLDRGRVPAAVCGYLRDLVDWPDEVVSLNSPGAQMAEQGDYARVLKYETARLNEYFVVENRSRAGIDSAMPSSGLAVFHCDTLGSNEWEEGTRERHYQAALVQADGHLDLEGNRNQGDAGDLYGERTGVALDDETLPSSRLWDSSGSGLVISDVSGPGATINFALGRGGERLATTGEATADLLIPDADPAGAVSTIRLDEPGTVTAGAVDVDIIHPYIGDLRVELVAPSGGRFLLHDRAGRDGDDIRATYRSGADAAIAGIVGEQAAGVWALHAVDTAKRDTGRINAWRIELDFDPASAIVEGSSSPALPIPDNDPRGVADVVTFPEGGTLAEVEVTVAIAHSFIGDLAVELVSPSGSAVLLHRGTGGGRDDLRATFSASNAPGLAALRGQVIEGDWTLRVRDLAARDEGTLEAWSLRLTAA